MTTYDEATSHLTRVDPDLGTLMARVGPCRLAPASTRSPYEALVKAVVYQQLNGTAAGTIFSRLKALFPGGRFPSARNLLQKSDVDLRGAGLSRNKLRSIRDIAENTVAGVVPTRQAISQMSDGEILERLTQLKGVGPWTVEMLLIFTLGRKDVLPASDYGVRKGFALVFGHEELPTPKHLLDFGEKWRPFRTVAAWYLWRALELPTDTPRTV